ncbi:hypothetical protein GGR53DRAFT_532608 [Hypoxylon sp. FL1150]|nr:hypothetical protein GGR53DRAFT_532608 [Hypoxylon sp. FL1150]
MTTILNEPGTNPPNPFTTPIRALLTSSNGHSRAPAPTPNETAAHLVATVTTSPNPAKALWELWDAFFVTVVTSPPPWDRHFALLDAVRAQPSTLPNNVPAGSDAALLLRSYTRPSDGRLHWAELPRFGAQWRDVHDVLEAWRDWDGVRASPRGAASASGSGSRGDEYFLHFIDFSTALLEATGADGEVHPINVFYACRNVLEREGGPEPREPGAHKIPPEQVWALDVRVAAMWVRDGGEALWGMNLNSGELREHFAATLDYKTELWPREDGLTRERWRLWGERLRVLSTEERNFDEETRAVITEAANVVEDILAR